MPIVRKVNDSRCTESWLCTFRASRWVGLLTLSIFCNATVLADVASVRDADPSFSVSKFVVEGDNPISKSKTNAILDSYLNRDLTIEQLREAASELEKELARRGHNFYRAQLPPQTLHNGEVRLAIEAIDIADVVVTGNQHFSNNNIQRSLPLVKKGRSPNTQQIANALLLAEDNPAKDIRVIFVKGDEPQTVDANIAVKDQNPNEFFVWANNAGSRISTDTRLGFQYHNRNLWGLDHQVALSYTVSPEDTDELNQYGINYRLPIYTLRGMANIFYSESDADTGRVADVFDISGAGETLGVGYTQYLDKHGSYQHRLGFDIIDKLFDSDVLFRSENIGEDVRSRPLTVEYTGRMDQSNWVITSVLSHSTNLSGGSLNDDETYQRVRAGAKQNWDKQNLALRLDYRWNREWNSRALLFAQTASGELIPGEQFGLGGALGDPGPRGFYEREVTMDEGIKASFEVSRRFGERGIQLGAFFDYATGDLINAQVGESPEETLSSVGIKLKWAIRPDLSLDLDYGYVIDGIDQEFTPDGTDDGDSRVHLSLRYFPKWRWGNE